MDFITPATSDYQLWWDVCPSFGASPFYNLYRQIHLEAQRGREMEGEFYSGILFISI